MFKALGFQFSISNVALFTSLFKGKSWSHRCSKINRKPCSIESQEIKLIVVYWLLLLLLRLLCNWEGSLLMLLLLLWLPCAPLSGPSDSMRVYHFWCDLFRAQWKCCHSVRLSSSHFSLFTPGISATSGWYSLSLHLKCALSQKILLLLFLDI